MKKPLESHKSSAESIRLFAEINALSESAIYDSKKPNPLSSTLKSKELLFKRNEKKDTPLLHAVRNQKYNAAGYLLEIENRLPKKANDHKQLEQTDSLHNTALFLAVQHNNLPLVKLLLHHGASVNARNQWQQTALHAAMSSSHPNSVPIVEELLKHQADISLSDEFGKQAKEYIRGPTETKKQLLITEYINAKLQASSHQDPTSDFRKKLQAAQNDEEDTNTLNPH